MAEAERTDADARAKEAVRVLVAAVGSHHRVWSFSVGCCQGTLCTRSKELRPQAGRLLLEQFMSSSCWL